MEDTGEIVGIITRGLRYSDSFSYLVLIRRLKKWSEDAGKELIKKTAGRPQPEPTPAPAVGTLLLE